MDFLASTVQHGFVGSGKVEVEKDDSAGNVSPLDRFRRGLHSARSAECHSVDVMQFQ